MIQLPAPSPFIGGLFEQQLRGAGLATAEVAIAAGYVQVTGVADGDQATVEQKLAAHPPTAQAALDARSTETANETGIRDQATQALTANRNDITINDAFLAVASPTNAQVTAQVKELTRQSSRQARELNALVRLALRRFDGTD